MKAAASRLLIPREHGTYGELVFPLLSALALAQPGRAAWGLVCVAVGGFLAHEGFAVLAGTRGVRAQRGARPVAWQSLITFGSLGLAGTVWGWPALSPETLTAAGIAAGLSVAAVALAWFGREHSLGGELMAALTLSSWCAPVGLAGGLAMPMAAGIWLTWFGIFAMVTCAVRVVVARTARRPVAPVAGLGLVFGGATMSALVLSGDGGSLPASAWVILIPTVIAFLVLTFAPIRATQLRQIGWSIMGVSLLTLALMVIVLR